MPSSRSPRPGRRRVRPAALAAATLTGVAVVAVVAPGLAAPVLAAPVVAAPAVAALTPGAAASPAATTAVPTTSTTTTRPPTTASPTTSSCGSAPSTTVYAPGTVLATYRFDAGGVPTAWSADSPVVLRVETGTGTAGSGALRADGLDAAHPLRLRVDTHGWGPFRLTATVRPDRGLPSQLSVVIGGLRRLTRIDLDPTTSLTVAATFDAQSTYAEWSCRGTRTGGVFPGITDLEFRVGTRCADLDPARSVVLDDVVIERTATPSRARPGARVLGRGRLLTGTTAPTTATTTTRASTGAAATTTRPTSGTTSGTTSTTTTRATTTSTTTSATTTRATTTTTTTSPLPTCPAVTSNPPTTTRTPSHRPTTSKSPKPTLTRSSTSPGPPAFKCKVTLSAVNTWPGGWSAALQIANFSPTDVTPWSLTATVPTGETLAYGWPATFTQSGTKLTAVPPSFQATLKGKSKVNWGLVLGGGSSAPTGWAINGTACAVS